MKHLLSTCAFAGMMAVSAYAANPASDNAGNYGGGWTNGSNGGTGLGPWSFNISQGTGFSGAFIGNPGSAGITNFPDPAFGLYANPGGSGASVSVTRSFTGGGLSVGQSFSFQWAVNWDSDTGNKGFNLFADSGSTFLLNVNQAGFPGPILRDGIDTLIPYGTQPMTWKFTQLDTSTLRIEATDRNGGLLPLYTADILVLGSPDTFQFYAENMSFSDNRQPYFNNLSISAVPEPSTVALLAGVAALGIAALRRRKA